MSYYAEKDGVGRIVNCFNLLCAASGGVAISPDRSIGGRAHGVCVWRIVVRDGKAIQVKTDPNAAWYHRGTMWFHGSGPGRQEQAEAFALAKAWAGQKYGIADWKRTAWGDWVEARVLDGVRFRRT